MRILLVMVFSVLALLLLWLSSRPVATEQPLRLQQRVSVGASVQHSQPAVPALAMNQIVGPRLRVAERSGPPAEDAFWPQVMQYAQRMTAKPSDEDVLILPQGKVMDLRHSGQSVIVARLIDGVLHVEEF